MNRRLRFMAHDSTCFAFPAESPPSQSPGNRMIPPTTVVASGYGPLLSQGRQKFYGNLQMREGMRERGDFLFAEGIGDFRHRGAAAAGSHARFVVVHRLAQIVLALAGDAGHRLGTCECIAVA